MPRIRILSSDESPDEPVGRAVPSEPLTFEEFHDWCDEDTWAEWVDGKVKLVSPASTRHQRIARFLAWLIQAVAEESDAGEVFPAPYLMRLPETLRRGREPDLIFVAKDHLERLRPTYLDGPADLVVEIVSPESLSRDRVDKLAEYEVTRLSEYWLVDTPRKRFLAYRLGADGRYQLAFDGQEGWYESRVLPGLRLEVSWLWQEPPPKQIEVRRALGVP